MGDQVEVDLIVKAISEGFGQLADSLKPPQKEVDILAEKFKAAAKSNAVWNNDASGALKTFGINLNALDNPITAFADGIKSAMDETVAWAGTVDELSRITGQGAEETSKLAIVMEDIGISSDTLKSASKSLKEQGLVPTLDTIKKLAGEYQAIQDPVERNKWGAKTLGKAYFDLSEALTKTPEELDALGAAALKSGRIMSQEAVDAAENYEVALAQLQDMIKGVQVAAGNVMIPTVLAAGEALQTEAKIVAVAAIEFQRLTGQIDYNEAAQRAAAVAAGDLGAVFEEQIPVIHDVNERITDTTFSELRMTEQTAALNSVWQNYGPTVSDAVVANQELKDTLEPLTGIASDLAFGMGELTTATLSNAAAAGLNAEDAYKLAQQMGLIDEAAANAKTVLDELRTQFEKTDDIETYTRNVGLLDAAVRSLPSGQTITIEIFEQYRQQYMDEFNAENSGQGGTETGQISGATGDGTDADGATGLHMIVPAGYPNDSFRVGTQTGEVVDVWRTPQERARAMAGGGDTITNNFYDHRAYAMWQSDQRRKKRARADALMGA